MVSSYMRRVSVSSDLITAVPVGSMTIQSSKADFHPVVGNQRMDDTGPFLVSFPLSEIRKQPKRQRL